LKEAAKKKIDEMKKKKEKKKKSGGKTGRKPIIKFESTYVVVLKIPEGFSLTK